ncbi:MAG TPA: hypothetical protein VGJ58_10950 [Gaiellaceae bacterium]
MNDRGHAARLLGLLRLTLAEFEEATAALLDDVRRQEVPFEESLRLAQVVHLRVETFRALAWLAVERLGRPTELAEPLRSDRDFHVRLDDGRTAMVASILADSGDAQIAPGSAGVDLRDLIDRLEDCFRAT